MALLVTALVAYLVGSFPTAYLVARWRAGVDIRTVGSGNVGGSNMRAIEGTWATVFVGVLDLLKGALPAWLAVRLGWGMSAACVAAVAVVVGHDWPLWLRLRGGRGGASTLGTTLVIFPYGFLWILGFMTIGKVTRTTAILHLGGVASVPLVAWLLGRGWIVVATFGALTLLMVIKRLEANQGFRVASPAVVSDPGIVDRRARARVRRHVLVNRLLLDRDQR